MATDTPTADLVAHLRTRPLDRLGMQAADRLEALEAENDRLRKNLERDREMLPTCRPHIWTENRCEDCGGSGIRTYGGSSTWRGGIGGQAVTSDVCDQCWGSGEKDKPWPSWREREAESERLRAALAQSDQPCVYCSLPAAEWSMCQSGFPGCGRADDAMGCPILAEALRLRDGVQQMCANNAAIQEAVRKIREALGE